MLTGNFLIRKYQSYLPRENNKKNILCVIELFNHIQCKKVLRFHKDHIIRIIYMKCVYHYSLRNITNKIPTEVQSDPL